MKKLIAIAALLLTPIVTGCHAPASVAVAPTAAPAAAPRVLPGAQARRILATEGSAAIWGITYSQYFTYGSGNYDQVGYATLTGGGTLTRAAYNRYVYQVPDDQVLIINNGSGGSHAWNGVAGKHEGAFAMNGFVQAIVSDRDFYYVFGPGELIVFTLYPNGAYSSSYSTSFFPIAISGYTASPDILASTGGLGGKKGK